MIVRMEHQYWPHQLYAIQKIPSRLESGVRRICVTSPTGGGKTTIISALIEWAVGRGRYVVLYTNRKLLIDQLSRVLSSHGIRFGVRAAGHEDQREIPVQISSLPTEQSRVLKSQRWEVHGKYEKVLAIIDEAHINKSNTAQAILGRHIEDGGAYVGFTATPIDLGHLYDELIVAGKMSELRKCGALTPAWHFGIDEPDMSKFKPNLKTGEYTENQVRKAIMHKAVWGRVFDHYKELNSDQRPTILFGPGVQESIWFAEQFSKNGVRAAHIDGQGIWLDGEYQKNQDLREDVLKKVRTGDIKVLCNRFVCREGLDLPEVSHLILATVMGSLQTYLQSAGRGLRACDGKERLTIQDHGGHWHRHGSVNIDRNWDLNYTENIISGLRQERLREKKEHEPICCPNCGQIRSGGPKCLNCGHEASRSSRMVVQHDGRLVEHVGDVYKPRAVREYANTEKLWTSAYYRARKSRNGMTFSQAEGLFFYENHYYPPRTLPLMPKDPLDWFSRVKDVPVERLTGVPHV